MTRKELIYRVGFRVGYSSVTRSSTLVARPAVVRLFSYELSPTLWKHYVSGCRRGVQWARYFVVSVQPVVSCRVCQELTEPENLTHLKIYVAGSEGVEVCITCRQVLTEVLRGMMRANIAGSKRGYLAAKTTERQT